MADFDADDAEDEQSILFEMSRPHWLFFRANTPTKEILWLYGQQAY